MSFLNPIMLAGLAAIAIPIIIHLLNRRKFQKVVWAAMRFLRASIEKNQRRMQIEDLILLALRCLVVSLIALALARPTWKDAVSSLFGGGRTVGVLLLDNSLSMGMSDGTTTRFDKARKAAEQALDALQSGSSMAVWLVSDAVRDVIPEPTFDLNLARKAIREATLTDRGSDLGGAVDRALELLKTRMGARRELYVFTDGQASGWHALTEIRSRLEKAHDQVQAHLIFVNEHETKNLSVRDLRLTSGLAPIGQPLRFEIKVQNHGAQPANNVRVTLTVDSDPVSDEFTLPQIGPGETKGVALFAKLRTPGVHAVHASAGEDRLPADNRRTLAVRAIQQLKLLLVDGDAGDSSRTSETFFLRHALNPVATEQIPNYFIRLQTIQGGDLASAALEDFDAVILANVSRFPERMVPTLSSYVRRGGGLLVFPGDKIDPDFYNEQLGRKAALLPALFGETRGKSDQTDSFFGLQSKEFSHPVTSLWNDPAAGTLSSVRVFQHHLLTPLTLTNAADVADIGALQTVLSYTDGQLAVVEHSFGLGRVVQFSSTADTAWNDLPVRPAFVPLLHRCLGLSIARLDEGLNLRVGARYSRRVNVELLGKDAAFTNPGKASATRELRRVEMVGGNPSLSFDHTDNSGLYQVQISDPPYETAFATQAGSEESSLEELTAEQLQSLRLSSEVYAWSPGFSLRQTVERQRSGVEFWPAVITAALALALCECFLGQWFSRTR